jgi:carbamoyltransferase
MLSVVSWATLDVLVVGNCILKKSDQDAALKRDYKEAFEVD